VLSIKDGDATDHKSKIAQPVSLVTNCKTLLGNLEIDKLINTPGLMNAVRLKEFITALLHTVPVGIIFRIKHTVGTPAGSITASILMMMCYEAGGSYPWEMLLMISRQFVARILQ
jgi:hypothetical protein